MKILIVTWYFPPVNTIGAVRTGKFARFLAERGHEVGVVAGRNWGHPETMPLDVPLERLAYAGALDLHGLPSFALRLLARGRRAAGPPTPAARPRDPDPQPSVIPSVIPMSHLRQLYRHLTTLPDGAIGWLPGAYRAAIRLCRGWRPDLIFASGPPFTAHLVARAASARLGIPWVGELRDRWADDPYETFPPWRHRADQTLERHILGSALGLVTVSEPWAEFYRRKYGKPLAMILNGYDPADFDAPAAEEPADPAAAMVIGYAGSIYPGKRDPTPLFQALRQMGAAAEEIRIVFCGTDPALVLPLAERAGVASRVEVRPPVPYHQSLAFQRQCDILLLMQWNDPREQGSCPGKLFEYLASLRPVLVLGLEDGVPATFVRERAAGLCANTPEAIAAQLRVWLAQKRQFGRVPALPPRAREGLSRTLQFARLEQFLEDLLAPVAAAAD